MSEIWTGVCDDTLNEAEYEILEISGMNEHEFHSYPVYFEFGEKDWRVRKEDPDVSTEASSVENSQNVGEAVGDKVQKEYIWTYEFGYSENPVLVIVHGYGGSGMIFYKMFTQLQQHFHVYCIDILGMGRS